MNERERAAFVIALVDALAKSGWVGKTHVQKTTYFAQEAGGASLDFRFVIHHYGPYSFDLDALVQTLESEKLLDVTPEPDGHGYSVLPGEAAREIEIDPEVKARAEEIASYFSGMQAAELELLSTAYYVRRRLAAADEETWVREVRRLKPKFSEAQVSQALDDSLSIAEALTA